MNDVPLHGGDIHAAARELGCSITDILDYSANINPLGYPAGLKRHLFEQFNVVHHYPDPYGLEFRDETAQTLGLTSREILAGNGTTTLMYQLIRVLKPKRAAIAIPAFAEYETAVRQAGLEPTFVACRPENDFRLTAEILEEIFAGHPDVVFLANPTSPAGHMVPAKDLALAARLAERSGAYLILDEAFIDFTDSPSLCAEVRKYPHLIVLHSLTKIYALPGLRLGYLTASEEVVGKLEAASEPWSINSLALMAGRYCLGRQDFVERTRRVVSRERKWLSDRLTELQIGRVFPGEANFLLMHLETELFDVGTLAAALRKKGVLVRECASFQGILKDYVRFAVKARASNRRLVQILKETVGMLSEAEGS